MSLGVKQLWGFYRRVSLAPRVSSLIPRGPLLLARDPPPSPAATAFFFSSRQDRQAGAARSLDAGDRNGEAVAKSATTSENTIDGGSKTAQNPSALFIERLLKLPVRAQDTHLPVTVNIYRHQKERERELYRLRHYLYQQQHHNERFLQKRNPPSRDWRRILQTLLETTPIYTANFGTSKVSIPESVVPQLATDPVHNIWEIKSQSGCEIQVHERNPDDPQDETYLLLSGDCSAIDRAVDDIRRIVPSANELRVVRLAEEEAQRLREHVSPIPWKRETPVRRKFYLYRPLDEIEKPETWTFDTFERYITTLIYCHLPPGRGYTLTRGRNHTLLVTEALLGAFRDPAALPALNATSFKHALKYLAVQGTAFWDQSKELLNMMMSRGFKVTTEIYDSMSLSALVMNDIGFFQTFVNQMAKKGLHPSVQTWTHFLRIVKVEEIRRYILHAMASKRLLDHPSAMHFVSGEMIEHDVYRAIKDGFDAKSFVASQNALYGPEWLHWQTSNKVLYELGSHGKFDEIDEFLTIMFQSAHAKPRDEIALNIILTHCRCQRKLGEAIQFVKRFEIELPVFRASGITFHLLSAMAWEMNRPHVLSVLWRYSFFNMLAPRQLTLYFHQLLSSPEAPRHISDFIRDLKIPRVDPPPPDGRWVGLTLEDEHRDVRSLCLFMEDLFLCDYKREKGINRNQLLTSTEFTDAIKVWYPETFRQKKPVYTLGELLALATEADRKIYEGSKARKRKAGKGIISLDPVSITSRSVVRRVLQKRPPKKNSRSVGVQDRSQLDETGVQAGATTKDVDLGAHHPEPGLAQTDKVDEEREAT